MTDEQFERYNAMTFEAYCKTAIDRAIIRGRRQKRIQAQREVSMSELPEAALVFPCAEMDALLEEQKEATIFLTGDYAIPILDENLARALLSLTPQRRNILLLAYFLDETDEVIARDLRLSQSAVQRRRASTLELIRQMMRGNME